MVELLPCPFCGGSNVEVSFDYERGMTGFCNDCEAAGPSPEVEHGESEAPVRAKAIELWNRRAPLPPAPLTPKVQRLA